MSATFESSAFVSAWNALDRSKRLQLRRTVRMGRAVADPELKFLAPEYARWQMQRAWMRYFWFWFVPGIVVVLGLAAEIHPVVLGITIALGGQAVWAYISLRKLARRAT